MWHVRTYVRTYVRTCKQKLVSVPRNYVPYPLIQTISATYTKIAESDPADARDFIQHIDDCNKTDMHDANLQDHNKTCHVDPDACGSMLLYLRCLAPHFPDIRQIVKLICCTLLGKRIQA